MAANGKLEGKRTHNGWTTWTWDAREPMATYLATMNTGKFKFTNYAKNGIRFIDAIDPDLFTPIATPSTGSRFALSGGPADLLQALGPPDLRSPVAARPSASR